MKHKNLVGQLLHNDALCEIHNVLCAGAAVIGNLLQRCHNLALVDSLTSYWCCFFHFSSDGANRSYVDPHRAEVDLPPRHRLWAILQDMAHERYM